MSQQSERSASLLPRRSPWLFQRFRKYALGYVRKRNHAVRVACSGPLPALPDGPLIVVMNHPSWWDPMIGLVLAYRMPDRNHYAPIESKGLAQYPFLERLGFFGIATGTGAGARSFLRRSLAILEDPKGVIWVTAQGEFVDPRDRPVRFKEGVGYLIHRVKQVTIWVLAVEYPFWEERTPEVLLRFAPAIVVDDGRNLSPSAWTIQLESAMQTNQDALAVDAIRRDPSRFDLILGGESGVGGVYDLWRKLKAIFKGEAFVADHGTRLSTPEDISR